MMMMKKRMRREEEEEEEEEEIDVGDCGKASEKERGRGVGLKVPQSPGVEALSRLHPPAQLRRPSLHAAWPAGCQEATTGGQQQQQEQACEATQVHESPNIGFWGQWQTQDSQCAGAPT